MNLWVVVVVVVLLSLLSVGGLSKEDSNSTDVNIGAILSFNSINGRVSKIAMKAAVEDINSDPTVLGGRKLVLSTHDSNYSGFLGIIGGTYVYGVCVCVSEFMCLPY